MHCSGATLRSVSRIIASSPKLIKREQPVLPLTCDDSNRIAPQRRVARWEGSFRLIHWSSLQPIIELEQLRREICFMLVSSRRKGTIDSTAFHTAYRPEENPEERSAAGSAGSPDGRCLAADGRAHQPPRR
jgi:hypothetical protein